MRQISFEELVAAEGLVPVYAHNEQSFLSYKEFLSFFKQCEVLGVHHLVIGAHFTYGWMPTMLDLRFPEKWENAVEVLNKCKRGYFTDVHDLELLKTIINNSLVGASKLLHFVNPGLYAIWDSRVYLSINRKEATDYQIGNPKNYRFYLDNCFKLVSNANFSQIHASVNNKVGFPVSALRAIDIILYEARGQQQAAS